MRFAATNEHTMHGRRLVVILAVLCTVTLVAQAPATSGRWSEARAAQWYATQPWLVGSNYIPAPPSTSSRCGRPTRSIRPRSTRSSAGPRASA